MCVKPVQLPTAVVERDRSRKLLAGDLISCQLKNRPTDVPYITNYAGQVKAILIDDDGTSQVVVTSAEHDEDPFGIRYFTVVDELPDDWKCRILRKRG